MFFYILLPLGESLQNNRILLIYFNLETKKFISFKLDTEKFHFYHEICVTSFLFLQLVFIFIIFIIKIILK